MRIPIHFDVAEFDRLHAVAHAAAVQTGAKGHELDETIAGIVTVMAMQTNRATLRVKRRHSLRLVQPTE